MKNYFAQQVNIGGQTIEGPLVGITNLADVINRVIDFLIPIGGIILLFVMIWGGYDYLMSAGQPEKLKNAKGKITTGIIGFVLLVFSYIIVKLIAKIFGLDSGIL